MSLTLTSADFTSAMPPISVLTQKTVARIALLKSAAPLDAALNVRPSARSQCGGSAGTRLCRPGSRRSQAFGSTSSGPCRTASATLAFLHFSQRSTPLILPTLFVPGCTLQLAVRSPSRRRSYHEQTVEHGERSAQRRPAGVDLAVQAATARCRWLAAPAKRAHRRAAPAPGSRCSGLAVELRRSARRAARRPGSALQVRARPDAAWLPLAVGLHLDLGAAQIARRGRSRRTSAASSPRRRPDPVAAAEATRDSGRHGCERAAGCQAASRPAASARGGDGDRDSIRRPILQPATSLRRRQTR